METLDIIIIGKNEGITLQKCIASAKTASVKLLNKISVESNIIYVDSGSTDDSIEVAKNEGVKVEFAPEGFDTPANGRNTGFFLTRGGYVMFMDGDMEMYENWLVDGIDFLQNNNSAAGVGGIRDDKRLVGSNITEIKNYDKIYKNVEPANYRMGGAFLFKRKALEDVNGFEPSVPVNEEIMLYCELKSMGWELFRIARPMIVHWDMKAGHLKSVINNLIVGSRSKVPGAILRYALFNTKWGVGVLKYQRAILIHGIYMTSLIGFLVVLYFNQVQTIILLLIAYVLCYIVYAILRKKSILLGIASLPLMTIYFINLLIGFLFNYPKIQFGLNKTDKYHELIQKANDLV